MSWAIVAIVVSAALGALAWGVIVSAAMEITRPAMRVAVVLGAVVAIVSVVVFALSIIA